MFVRPIDIIQYLQYLYLVQKAVFYSSSFLILIKLYTLLRSTFVKITDSWSRSCILQIRGSIYLFLTVIVFSRQQSTTSCNLLLGLGTKSTSTPAGNIDFLINPFLIFLSRYSFNTSSSFSDIWYIGLNSISFPGLVGIQQSYSWYTSNTSIPVSSRNNFSNLWYSNRIFFISRSWDRYPGTGKLVYISCWPKAVFSLYSRVLLSLLQLYWSRIIVFLI